MMEIEQQEIKRITRLIKSLKEDSPVRQSAEAIIHGQDLSEEQISLILKAIEKPRFFCWKEQTVAAWALGRLQPTLAEHSSIVPRLGVLLNESEWPSIASDYMYLSLLCWRIFYISFPLALVMTLCTVIVMQFMKVAGQDWSMLFLQNFRQNLLAISLLASLPVILISSNVTPNRVNSVRTEVARALGRLGAVQSIPVLVEALIHANNRALEDAARESLASLFLLLTEENYGRLPARATPSLCQIMKQPGEPLALLALEALGKVGDGQAVQPVISMAQSGPTADLREMAERILPLLRERQQQEEERKDLLRASDVPQTAFQSLLHPARHVQQTEQEQLLRVSMPDEET